MTSNRFKILAIIFFAAPLVAVTVLSGSKGMVVSAMGEDPAVTYKAKCAVCHSPKAEKFFDPAKAEDVHVEAILKGKKGEKPPYMPGFEAKGMTPDEAKALVTYMKGLRAPAS
ncbi:MAG TPA: cytochrome c [Pyrinomonadaceae bacterium]